MRRLTLFLLPTLSLASVMNVASLQYRHQVNTVNTDRAKHFLIDEAEEFTRLYPEETKKRLGQLVSKIDSNRDGLVNVAELTEWIDLIHKDHIRRDVEREWLTRNPDQVDNLSWRLYKSNVYGALDNKLNAADTKGSFHLIRYGKGRPSPPFWSQVSLNHGNVIIP